ncbi:hypothetical protein GQ457_05G021010 [Hibiscus cannabinus]
MEPPHGFVTKESGLLCKLNKSFHGLKQASRQWNEILTIALIDQGFKHTSSDNSLFFLQENEIILFT